MEEMNVLILDDEPRIREELNDFLADHGFCVFEASGSNEAMPILEQQQIDIAIVDLNLPGKHGLDVLIDIKEKHPDTEVLIITGQGDMETAIKAMRNGAADFFNKPIHLNEVLLAIQRSTRYLSLSRQICRLSKNYDQVSKELMRYLGVEIIGHSAQIKKLMRDTRMVAQHPDTSVMICGESGTGKELVARSIHHLSSRSSGYFYAVNCAAIPDNLFESEFFGYEKGAFTGAHSAKPGWFETADRGTLFLDEIGDMNALMQAKLLRISEDGRVRRIGATKDRNVDVRIITATNRNIESMVADGSFRADLYHRLNTFQINIPPLRERKEDIPALVDYYLEHFTNKTGKKICSIDAELMDKLLSYNYPGNVRELKNMLDRAVILCNNRHIGIQHFRCELWCQDLKNASEPAKDEIYDLKLLERQTIEKALIKTNYNKMQAARLLNISWQALDRRLKDAGI